MTFFVFLDFLACFLDSAFGQIEHDRRHTNRTRNGIENYDSARGKVKILKVLNFLDILLILPSFSLARLGRGARCITTPRMT